MDALIDGVSLFRRVEEAEVGSLAEDVNLRLKAVCSSTYACISGVAGLVLVQLIDNTRNIPKIFDPVVSAVAIDVINLVIRELAVMVEPDKAMSLVDAPVDLDLAIPSTADRPRNVTNFDTATCRNLPDEIAGIGVVVEEFFQPCLGDHVVFGVSGDQ